MKMVHFVQALCEKMKWLRFNFVFPVEGLRFVFALKNQISNVTIELAQILTVA